MLHKWLEIASSPSVKAVRARYGSAAQYGRLDRTLDPDGPVRNDRIGEAEAAFIAGQNGFYLASVSETGWPYVQYRGGPAGFLRVIDERTLGYAEFRGNRQYVTTGNVAVNDRVSLFLMDYAHQRRLKIFGRMWVVDGREDPERARRGAHAHPRRDRGTARGERTAAARPRASNSVRLSPTRTNPGPSTCPPLGEAA